MRTRTYVKYVSVLLVASFLIGLIPLREVKADTSTGSSSELEVTYQEVSSWGDFTQAQVDVTNISSDTLDGWNVSLEYDEVVSVSSIWNASLCESDISTEHVLYITNESYNAVLNPNQTVSFGLITECKGGLPDVVVVEDEEELPSEEETDLFPCAVFSNTNCNFSGWKSTIAGDFYTGGDFNYQGSELYLYGSLDTVGSINANGWQMEIGEENEGCEPVEMPDFEDGIFELGDELDFIDEESLVSSNSVVANGFYYADEDVTIEGTEFEGDCVIVATGDITYNVDALSGEGRVVLYSQYGNITINGSQIVVNGILYAPEGQVNINAYDTTFNGRIIADEVNYSGSILNVTASESDLELLYELPDVTVTGSAESVMQGEYAYFEISLDDEEETPFNVLYRLNDEDVELDESLIFELDTTLAGNYTLEAYVETSNGTQVLDSDSIVVEIAATPEPTATPVPTEEPTTTPTPLPSPTAVPTPTAMPTPTDVPTPTVTPTPEPTATPIPTSTPTPIPTATPVPTSTPTPLPSPTAVPTPTAMPTPTDVPTPTVTPTPEPTLEPTVTPTPIPTEEPTPTPIPSSEDSRYYIFSEGDVRYHGYRSDFLAEDWKCSGTYSFAPNAIGVSLGAMFTSATIDYNGTRAFSPDYSLDGRFTVSKNQSDVSVRTILYIINPNGRYDDGSIGISADASTKSIRLILNGDTNNPVATYSYPGINELDIRHEIWFEYDGENKVFNVYVASYDASGNVTKPEAPCISYEMDFAEVFGDSEEFTLRFTSATGFMSSSMIIHGVELDPYPAIHENDDPVTPTPTPIPEVADSRVSFSQGNTEYGYQEPFIEDNWAFEGDGSFENESNLFVNRADNGIITGSAFAAFAKEMGDDYSFYTRFSFTNETVSYIYSSENQFENGFAFVIQPYNGDMDFYGDIGYGRHTDSVVVEFDFNAQNEWFLNENGEFEEFTESNSHVGIMLDGDETHHYAVADYPLMRQKGFVTDVWVEYDNEAKLLSVYVCTINDFGRIYKYDEPLLTYSINLEEYFGGCQNLYMGFVSRDVVGKSNISLNGFEFADEPFEALAPDDYPIEEQDRYRIVSIGDSVYGYQKPFIVSEWNRGGASLTSTAITVHELFGDDGRFYTRNTYEFSPDYSFSGRFTYSIEHGTNYDNCSNLVIYNPNATDSSIAIHCDIAPSSEHYWKDPYGQGDWQFGTEPYSSSIGIALNNDIMREYCMAEYTPFLDANSVHEIWFEYDGVDKIFYVYVAAYNEDGTVEKPSTPTLMMELDMEELWGGAHEFTFEFDGQGGWDPADFILRGIEIDPYPMIHGNHEEPIELLTPYDGRIYENGDIIEVFGRINEDADTVDISVINERGEEVFSDTTEPNEHFEPITEIDTADFSNGEYTIHISISNKEETIAEKEVSFTLVPDPVTSIEITDYSISTDGMDVIGTIDVSIDSSYTLYRRDETDYWVIVSTGEGNVDNSSLGFIDIDDLPADKIELRLVVTLSNGDVETVIEFFEYDLNSILNPVTPTPTPTPGDNPGSGEFTDEELLVELDDEQEGMEVTFISDIIGTVSGTKLTNYTFEVFPVGSDIAVYQKDGTEAITDDVVGTVDATLLFNGYYNVVLTGYTEDGSGLYDDLTILVTGTAKIGNFSMSFLDLSTGLNNFPIDIYRTYDSRNLNEIGDFGYGWNMSVAGPEISFSTNLGENWRQATSDGFVVGYRYFWVEDKVHEVTVDWGNGKTETFAMKLDPFDQNYIKIESGITASFEAQTGCTSTLEFLDVHTDLWYLDDILMTDDLVPFNPQNFLLTTRDGTKYYFNVETGLYKVEDTYGRVIEISDDGVFYTDGSGITINRDEEGKITSITDGTQTVSYTYDENGDLVSVTERTGDVVSYGYDDHYLNDIIDARGIHAARNEYDEDGRLVATIDADGNRTEFDHNLADRIEVITNRLGYSTIYGYDEYGNVVAETDALGRTTTRTYDENHNMTSETNPAGNTSYYNYSATGDLISVTNSLGYSAENTYSSSGVLLSMSSSGITEFSLVYDSSDNLVSSTDALGNVFNYEYSSNGEFVGESDSIGQIVFCTYDENGYISSITSSDGVVTNFTHDSQGRVINRTYTVDDNTLTTTYTYDNYDNVIGITNSDGTTVSCAYDSVGNCISSTDSLGNTTNYTYDIYNNLSTISYPNGTQEHFSYDLEGQQLSSTNIYGKTTFFSYDAVGNVEKITYSSGVVMTYTYDECDRVISIESSKGGKTTYTYDSLGRNTSVTDVFGNVTSYTYTAFNQVASMTDANGNTYLFAYDDGGNQTQVTYPDGSIYTSTYDVRGRIVSETNASGNTMCYSYDISDRLIGVTDSLGNTTGYVYDEFGHIISVTDALGYETTYLYDDWGRITSITNALGNTAYFTYDENGNISEQIDFGGNRTSFAYDSYGRLISESYEEGTVEYEYNSLGQLTIVHDITGDICYQYSPVGNLALKTDENNVATSYLYGCAGHVIQTTTDAGIIYYQYDMGGRLVKVQDDDGNITEYSYDGVGNLIETSYSNGVTTSYGYNEVNLLISQVTTNADGMVLASYEYTLGSNGERLEVRELHRTIEYSYDALDRLISEIVTTENGTTVTSYTYDANSNRLTKNVDGVVTTYTYNELNQLTSEGDFIYTYDDAGNLVAVSNNGVLTATYEYNSRNQMISAEVFGVISAVSETYEYNYLGDRISKTTNGKTTDYVLDYSTGLSQVLVANGEATVFNVRGLELISRNETTGDYFYLIDGGANIRGLTDLDGNITDAYAYDAFGNTISHEGTSDNEYGFQGEQQDETGLYYLRARYMNPSTGTFTSMDTFGGYLSDPTSLHKYLFANSNPVEYCDPSGYSSCSLTEQVAVCEIMGALCGAAFSLVNYIGTTATTDQEFSFNDLLAAVVGGMTGGILSGAAFGLVGGLGIGGAVVATGVGLGLGLFAGSQEIAEGIAAIHNGQIAYGVFKMLYGAAIIFLTYYFTCKQIADIQARIDAGKGPEGGSPNPDSPDNPNPDTPDSPNPDTPDSPNPDTPDSPNPDTPDSPNPDTPDNPNPDTPDNPNPDTPDNPNPDTPDNPNPDTPDNPNPDTPDNPNPDTPDNPNPDMPDNPNPDMPDNPNPDTPDNPNPDIPDNPNPDVPENPRTNNPTSNPDEGASVRNPNGKKGGERHQEVINDIVQQIEARGNTAKQEYGYNTSGGYKNTRWADVVEINADGEVVAIYQVGKVSGNGLPVVRESRAIVDIISSADLQPLGQSYHTYNGEPIYFYPYNSDCGPILYGLQ